MQPNVKEWAEVEVSKPFEPAWWSNLEERKVIYQQMKEMEVKHNQFLMRDQYRSNSFWYEQREIRFIHWKDK